MSILSAIHTAYVEVNGRCSYFKVFIPGAEHNQSARRLGCVGVESVLFVSLIFSLHLIGQLLTWSFYFAKRKKGLIIN
jgi:hypothetical protein